jgi:hypothetical protein
MSDDQKFTISLRCKRWMASYGDGVRLKLLVTEFLRSRKIFMLLRKVCALPLNRYLGKETSPDSYIYQRPCKAPY